MTQKIPLADKETYLHKFCYNFSWECRKFLLEKQASVIAGIAFREISDVMCMLPPTTERSLFVPLLQSRRLLKTNKNRMKKQIIYIHCFLTFCLCYRFQF